MKQFREVFSFNLLYSQDNSSLTFVSFKQPPQPPEPFESFAINVLYHHEIHLDFVGPAARHFGVFCVFCGEKISVYSCPFVVHNQSSINGCE